MGEVVELQARTQVEPLDLALRWYTARHMEQALAELEKALAREGLTLGERAFAEGLAMGAHMALGEMETALLCGERALEHHARPQEVRMLMARCRYELGEVEGYRSELEAMVEDDHAPGLCSFYLGRLDEEQGDFEAAIVHFQRAYRLGTPEERVLAARGTWVALLQAGHVDSAIWWAQVAHELAPDDVEVCEELAKLLLTLGHPARSLAASERTLVLEPTHDEALQRVSFLRTPGARHLCRVGARLRFARGVHAALRWIEHGKGNVRTILLPVLIAIMALPLVLFGVADRLYRSPSRILARRERARRLAEEVPSVGLRLVS